MVNIIKINILLSETIFVGQILKIENEKGLQEAESFYKKAVETRALQGNKDGEVWALKKLGNLQEDFKNWEKAENALRQAV
ncbi:MAG: tetratricopeptide repeat protein, partial [Nostocales cyanobacterium]